MYGLVNRFLKDKIVEFYGKEIWEKTDEKISEDVNFFIGMEQYPDDITYNIVGAVCEVKGIPAPEFLETAGRQWVPYTADSDFGTYYAMAEDLFAFLKKLNSIHSAMRTSIPELRPPVFNIVECDDKEMRLQYVSERPGLTTFVAGVLTGLGKHYGQEIDIEITAQKQNGADYDEYLITIL